MPGRAKPEKLRSIDCQMAFCNDLPETGQTILCAAGRSISGQLLLH
jgi:hypothetical protein